MNVCDAHGAVHKSQKNLSTGEGYLLAAFFMQKSIIQEMLIDRDMPYMKTKGFSREQYRLQIESTQGSGPWLICEECIGVLNLGSDDQSASRDAAKRWWQDKNLSGHLPGKIAAVREKKPSTFIGKGNQMILPLAIGVEMGFVKVPAGVYKRGSKCFFLCYRKMYLDEYWIGVTPVTNSQYQAFINAVGHDPPGHWEGGDMPVKKNDHPVVMVTWHDARAFCAWLSELGDEIIRLPNAAEWEKAARGTDGRKYPWGEKEPDDGLCNFDNNICDTTRVGRYSPAGDSPYGCVDMIGNVREWNSSTYEPIIKGDSGFAAGLYFGSFSADANFVTPQYVGRCPPDVTGNDFGFRCARLGASPQCQEYKLGDLGYFRIQIQT